MAGTFPGTANTQQHDINGQPMAGALLSVYQGGSSSALANTFQDIGLTLVAQNPLVADASGRIPMFFVADGTYGLRLTDAAGVQANGGFFYPSVPSIGASTSGGGGTPVDPTTVFSTGDWKWRPSAETLAGWVRLNGRTIGNASSGASELASASAQALFLYAWNTYADTICPVVGGRGANALADFTASKQITLLDMRGRSPFGLDDMGNAALGSFTGTTFTKGNATTGGSSGGSNSTTLLTANLPPYTPSGTNTPKANAGTNVSVLPNAPAFTLVNVGSAFGVYATTQWFQLTVPFVGDPQGGTSAPFSNVSSAMLGTHFWKL